MAEAGAAGESPAASFASVRFDLRRLAEQARDRGFRYSPMANDELHVEVGGSNPLVFKNLDGEDAAIGFLGAASHDHPPLGIMTGPNVYDEFEAEDILRLIAEGDLLIVEQFSRDELVDSWLTHRLGPLDLRYMESGEGLRIRRPTLG